jgi:hypothetical protein
MEENSWYALIRLSAMRFIYALAILFAALEINRDASSLISL